jgi:hypothetical protein
LVGREVRGMRQESACLHHLLAEAESSVLKVSSMLDYH